MTQRASGWYDDPHDDSQLRYFDGIMWSERTMPKLRPGLEHVGEARPESERPAHSEPVRRDGPAQTYPAHWGPETSRPPQGNHPYAPPISHAERPEERGPGRTAGLGARVLANIIDRIVLALIVSVGLMAFSTETISLMQNWLHDVVAAAQQGSSTAPPMPGPLQTAVVWVSLSTAGLGVLYDALMTAFCRGLTLGRMALGIKVVPATTPHGETATARVPFGASLLRSLIKWGPEGLGGLGELVQAVVFFSALGNAQRQGLHDRVAHTQVRRTR